MRIPSTYSGPYTSLKNMVALRRENCQLDLTAHSKALAAMTGAHRSPFRGRGIDFDEARLYQPGDDVRNIDWRVTARTGKPHTKVFREERERPIYILLDQRRSMFFGSQVTFKSVVAANIAAWLAWAAMDNHDRVGGLIFSDETHQEYRPKGGKQGVLQIIQGANKYNSALSLQKPSLTPEANKPQNLGAGAFETALATLSRLTKPGSLIFIISDFYGFDGKAERSLKKISRYNDVIALFVSDPLESKAPPAGNYTFGNGEERLHLSTRNKALRKAYETRFYSRREHLEDALRPYAIPLIPLSTHNNYFDEIRNILGPRKSATSSPRAKGRFR
ncbi:MAG: DUF58 domain-containing protein [Pseudomonadales bacterium]|nr:DUF58 domain-containing protein [Pseudomonadales bacterium]